MKVNGRECDDVRVSIGDKVVLTDEQVREIRYAFDDAADSAAPGHTTRSATFSTTVYAGNRHQRRAAAARNRRRARGWAADPM